MKKKFWMVWRTTGGYPMQRHATRELAEAESCRLAAKQVGDSFIILEAVSEVHVVMPPISITPLE